ncbi:MAG: glycosyltransferase family 4 protein [Planctomycetes bacterium]|nr:glycosyltransferase family 4 protein [Planctomycetota bacterium]
MLSRTAARAELGIGEAEPRAVAIGRLVPIKRLEHFVAMFGLDPPLPGTASSGSPSGADRPGGDIYGDGPERAALQRAIAAAAPGRVRLCGAGAQIASRLPAYDALVLPSVREGCPLVAVEAFAAGIPVVGYDVPGVRDVLSRWGGGVLVAESEGPRGLREGLRRLLADPGLRQRCRDKGAAALARFAPTAVARQLADSYAGD